MAKLTAVLLGTLAVYFIAFTQLPSSFNPLINWLGPLFGVSFQVMLSMVFFVLGSPLVYGIILVTWIVAGVIVGVFTRSLKGAIAAAPAVFSFVVTILGAAIGNIFFNLSKTGLESGNLPPPPPGTNSATILNVPVFKQLAPLFIGSIAGGGVPSTSSVVSSFVGPIIENFVILIAVAAGVGFLLGRMSKRMRKTKLRQPSVAAPPISPAAKVAALSLLGLLLIGGVAFPIVSAQSSFYSEQVIAIVNPDGSVTSYYAFITGSLTLPNSGLSTGSLSNTLFALAVSQSGSLSFLPQQMVQSFTQILGLLPPTLVVAAFNGDCSSTQSQASQVSSGLTSTFGLNDLSLLISTKVNESDLGMSSTGLACVYVYQSNVGMSSFASTLASVVNPAVHQSGLIDVFDSGLSSGLLIPGATSSSASTSALIAGFATAQFISQIPIVGTSVSGESGNQLLGFTGGIATLSSVYHSSTTNHTADLLQLLHYNGTATFATDATVSIAGVGVPLPNVQQEQTFSAQNYKFAIATNNAQAASSLVGQQPSGQSMVTQVQPGQQVQSSAVQTSFTKVFPANIIVSKSLTQQTDGTVLVSISVKNPDTDTLAGLALDDSSFINSYGGGLTVISGSPTSSQASLQPGGTASYSYVVKPSGIGTYVSSPTKLTYSLNGTEFTAYSNTAYYTKGTADPSQAFSALVNTYGSSIDSALGTSGTGALIATLVLVALVVLAGFMEYRAYRKWKKS